MRVAISGSPVSASRTALRSFTASMMSFCRGADRPLGRVRFRIGSPVLRNGTPWYDVGRKPLPYSGAPPRGPRGPDCSTTKPGRSFAVLPRPYVAHAPMLGRPAWGLPVLTNSFAGAWLKTLVVTVRTTAISSTILAVYGRTSETQ